MSNGVISKLLGSNSFYTEAYIKDSINFVKSIVFVNSSEANGYNQLIGIKYPSYQISSDKKTWRYYKHIQGLLHDLDIPVTAVSVDNGVTIELNKTTLKVHKRTKQEILKFGLYYDNLVKAYPEQALYIKSIVLDHLYSDIAELIELENFTIVSCNKEYIEENEDDLLKDLQIRINNYKSIWLLPYYAILDNLFLASQFHIFYNYLLTSLLAIRLENDKTIRAHSYHIRMYFASHHGLDKYILFLTKKQQLFLYRNMLYLDNHSGKNHVFQKLIDILFTERNISVVNYVFSQRDSLDLERRVNYVYNQKLLNSKPLVYSNYDYDLAALASKEKPLAPGNEKEYTSNFDFIDKRNKYSLFSTLLTKDLETILMDETDTVKYKLLDILTDYWAFLCKNNQVNFLVDITDPVSNVSTRMSAKDLFKFYVICLHARSNIQLTEFPEYRVKRVFKSTQPSVEQISKFFYNYQWEHGQLLKHIQDNIPNYSNQLTGFQFSEFISSIYKLEMGLWFLQANMGDMDKEGQMSMGVNLLHQNDLYSFNNETVSEFLSRVGIKDPRNYSGEILTGYLFTILDSVFDNRLSFLNKLQKLQQALTDIFFNFNSYTVQLINNYYSGGDLVAGVKNTRYSVTYQTGYDLDVSYANNMLLVASDYTGDSNSSFTHDVYLKSTTEVSNQHSSEPILNILVGIYAEPTEESELYFLLNSRVIHNVESDTVAEDAMSVSTKDYGVEIFLSTPIDPSSDANLVFLANNL